LWFFEEKTNGFVFGWENKGEINCVWSQIWFNVTLQENGEVI
jgi:phosphoribosylaminoimidazole-succinocarboxamide synthase